jgi:hypothetical protein
VAVLPPYITHQLQPLDVGIFGPLSNAYSKQLDDFMEASYDMIRMQKQDFWCLFKSSWAEAATEKNVLSAFEATGIYPIKPSRCSKRSRNASGSQPSCLKRLLADLLRFESL